MNLNQWQKVSFGYVVEVMLVSNADDTQTIKTTKFNLGEEDKIERFLKTIDMYDEYFDKYMEKSTEDILESIVNKTKESNLSYDELLPWFEKIVYSSATDHMGDNDSVEAYRVIKTDEKGSLFALFDNNGTIHPYKFFGMNPKQEVEGWD